MTITFAERAEPNFVTDYEKMKHHAGKKERGQLFYCAYLLGLLACMRHGRRRTKGIWI